MLLTLVFFIALFIFGVIGGYFVSLILERFPKKLKNHMEENNSNSHTGSELHQDIMKGMIREDYSLSYVGANTPYFLFIILFTSVIEALLFYIFKICVRYYPWFLLLIACIMVLKPPIMIELFVRRSRYLKSNSPNKVRRSDIQHSAYIFRIRLIFYGVAMIPLLIVSIL